jgi:hypothetical protein
MWVRRTVIITLLDATTLIRHEVQKEWEFCGFVYLGPSIEARLLYS